MNINKKNKNDEKFVDDEDYIRGNLNFCFLFYITLSLIYLNLFIFDDCKAYYYNITLKV